MAFFGGGWVEIETHNWGVIRHELNELNQFFSKIASQFVQKCPDMSRLVESQVVRMHNFNMQSIIMHDPAGNVSTCQIFHQVLYQPTMG